VLDGSGDNPGGIVIEVYDHPEPPLQIDVLPVEALPSWIGIVRSVVGTSHRFHDHVDVVEKPRTALGEMEMRAGIEDNRATVWIGDVGQLLHAGLL